MARPPIYLQVDTSDTAEMVARLQAAMKPEAFEKTMYGVFRRTGGHVKTILKKDIPPRYNVKPGEVGRTVQSPVVALGGMGVGCSIPVVGPRKPIGGPGGFDARGHRPGWKAVTSGHYPITAQIYRGQRSTLPKKLPQYGGNAPFRNIPSKLGGSTRTRAAGVGFPPNNYPIPKVMGIAVPQMPLNKAEPAVQKDIALYMNGRVAARLQALIKNGR